MLNELYRWQIILWYELIKLVKSFSIQTKLYTNEISDKSQKKFSQLEKLNGAVWYLSSGAILRNCSASHERRKK